VLVIRPEPALSGVKLEPIKSPLSEIVAAAEARIHQVLEDYQEKKRGRPAGRVFIPPAYSNLHWLH
jgi:hypothetical protein